jgi:hypothetical protein
MVQNRFFFVNLFSKIDEFSRLALNFYFYFLFSFHIERGGEETVMIYLIIHVQSNMNEYI